MIHIMTPTDRRFWPFRPRTSIASAIALLVGLLLIFVVLKKTGIWPTIDKSEVTVLIGILLFSLLPIVLALIDVIVERGGAIKVGGVEIDFSQVPKIGMSGFTVPANIGAPGQYVADSGTNEILDALRQAMASDIVTIDLEEGQAWWETRLLIMLSGAVRLGKPKVVVFVGMDAGIDKRFQGWSRPSELLQYLLRAHPQYPMSYHKAMAAARQWEMVEPTGDVQNPPLPSWGLSGLAGQHTWMAFNGTTGLPNELLAEQLLADDLGVEVESQEKPKTIGLTRLEELFRPVLHKESVDENWPAERQINAFFDSDSEYIAITRNGEYKTLVSRLSVLNTVVKTLAKQTS